MERLLCIVSSMNVGGAETFLMKIYRGLDREKYQMDFAAALKGAYDDEIRGMGGKIFYITPKSQGMLKNFNDIHRIVKENRYKSVLRVSENSLSALELFAAQLGGAKIRGLRSSNSATVHRTKKENLVHMASRWMPMLFANVRIAPSTVAAEHMFGKGCIQRGKAFLLKNGLDLNTYRYSEQARNEIRKELGIGNAFAVGHIGRFTPQKNHSFLIDVFAEIKKHRADAVLLLCGKGDKETEIREKVKQMQLDKDVLFLGVRSDIPQILSAMDVFVFPSLFEGMPNSVIEAQASGLRCVISDAISREAGITELVQYLPLGNAEAWTEAVLKTTQGDLNREKYNQQLREAGYDSRESVREFCALLFEREK